MGIVIPQYEDRLSPEGLMNIRATAPDMSVNPANTKGMQAFGEAMGTLGATQSHLQRQQANADAGTSALASLSAIDTEVRKDIYDGVDKMEIGGMIPGADGKSAPFSETMQAKIKARYDAVELQFANATPEVKNVVKRQIITALTSWNSEIVTQAEKGIVTKRLEVFDESVNNFAAQAQQSPDKIVDLLNQNKLAAAQLGINPEARYQKLIQSQKTILNAALESVRNDPEKNKEVIEALKQRLGQTGQGPNPYLQAGQAAGFIPSGVATSTDLNVITPAIRGGEGDTKNPTPGASADGPFQFINSTFISQAKRSYPELTQGKSDSEILGMRTTRDAEGKLLAEKMGRDFITDNAKLLAAAGFTANGTNVYLAHFLGAGSLGPNAKGELRGAINMLSAAPDTPIEQLTSAKEREQNPKILVPGRTAAQVIQWAAGRMNAQGGNAISQDSTAQPGQASSTGAPRQEVRPWVQGLVNQLQASDVSPALIASTSEMHRQAQTTAAAFQTVEADHTAKAMNGISIAQPLTQSQFQAQYPLDGNERFNSYAATLEAGQLLNGMKTMPIEQAKAALDAYKPDSAKPGYAAALTRYNAVADGLRNMDAARQKDQMQYALDNKIGGVQPIDFKSPEAMGAELKKRAALAGVMKDNFRTDGTSLFTTNEANALKSGLGKVTDVQALSILDTIRSSVTDPTQYSAVMNTLAKDQPVVAMAGRLLAKNGQVTAATSWMPGSKDVVVTPFDVAKTLLRGSHLLYPTDEQSAKDGKGKTFPMPPDKEFDLTFEAMTSKVFSGDANTRHEVLQATRAYYAASMEKIPNFTGVLEPGKVQEAVKAVTGGISDTYNVIRPWGWSEDTFINGVKGKLKDLEVAEKMTGKGNDTLSSAYLRPISDSKYLVTTANGLSLHGPTSGEPMIVDLYQKPGGRPPPGVTPPSQVPGADQNAAMAPSGIDTTGKGYVPPDMKTKLRGR